MLVVATTWPFALVDKSAELRLEKYSVPIVAREVDDWLMFTRVENVVDALKRLLPVKVLLFAKRVVEATVMVPPMFNNWPFTVPTAPVM